VSGFFVFKSAWPRYNPCMNRTRHFACHVFALVVLLEPAPTLADTAAGLAAYEQKNYAVAYSEWLKAAEKGDPVAQYNLSFLYDEGQGIEKDAVKGAEWLTKAAEQGYVNAQFNLGNNYNNGVSGVALNVDRAIHWLTKAAEQGDPKGQFNLGLIYENNEGYRDYAKAALWYGKAAAQDHIGALANLAVLYFNGQGVTQNYALSYELEVKADKLGSPVAARNLGNAFETGRGVARNNAEAMTFYRRAASLGDYRAKMILAFRYRDGEIVERDVVMAHVYASLALVDPNRETIDGPETNLFRRKLELDMIAEHLSESELLQALFLQTSKIPSKSASWKN
jgi:uncharacterized protein